MSHNKIINDKYFDNDFSKTIFRDNYCYNNESIEDMWRRIAKACSQAEKKNNREYWEEKFYNMLKDFKVLPAGRIMANMGIPENEKLTFANCFVHHPKDVGLKNPDSIEGIYDLLKAQALTLKSEGGLGTNFSYLRPAGTYIRGIRSRSPGPVKFMELWDKSSEIITQGSDIKLDDKNQDKEKKKIRKGAQIAVLDIWHPSIEEFITAKQGSNKLTKFNLSVGITEGFINAVVENQNWELIFPDTTFEKYDNEWDGDIENWKKKNYPIVVYKKIKAKELWDKIIYNTFQFNEPGVLFLDIANKLNPLQYCEKIFACNPCGEITSASNLCVLTPINLTQFVKFVDNKPQFDFDEFKNIVETAIRFLDNVSTLTPTPLKDYAIEKEKKRSIGLGTMGLASTLLMLGIRYGSNKECLEFVEKLYKTKQEIELLTSAKLGKEKGNFPLFNKHKYFNTHWWKTLFIDNTIKKQIEKLGCMRNAHHSANAPNGNTSLLANIVSGGIEPIFSLEAQRYVVVSPEEKNMLKKKGFNFPDVFKGEWFETEYLKIHTKGKDEILAGVFDNQYYSIDKNRGLTKKVDIKDYGWQWINKNLTAEKIEQYKNNNIFVCVDNVDNNVMNIDDHLSILNIVAKYTDMSTSKTINVVNDFPFVQFKDVYLQAWQNNIKGITTYRAGTMTAVLESKQKIQSHQTELEQLFNEHQNKIIPNNLKLPEEFFSKGFVLRDNGTKKWYINIAFTDQNYKRPFAVFVQSNNKESTEVTDKVIQHLEGLLLSEGIEEKLIIKQREKYSHQTNLQKIARIISMCLRHNVPMEKVVEILSEYTKSMSDFLYYLKKLLANWIPEGTVVKAVCPECGKKNTLVYESSCKICKNCGWGVCV